jgi:hypothetical protein
MSITSQILCVDTPTYPINLSGFNNKFTYVTSLANQHPCFVFSFNVFNSSNTHPMSSKYQVSYFESFGIQVVEKPWLAHNGVCMLPQVPTELHLLQNNCCSFTLLASCLDIETFIANLPLLKNLTPTRNMWNKPINFVANIHQMYWHYIQILYCLHVDSSFKMVIHFPKVLPLGQCYL